MAILIQWNSDVGVRPGDCRLDAPGEPSRAGHRGMCLAKTWGLGVTGVNAHGELACSVPSLFHSLKNILSICPHCRHVMEMETALSRYCLHGPVLLALG